MSKKNQVRLLINKKFTITQILFFCMVFTLPFTNFPTFEIGFTVQMSYIFALFTFISLFIEEIKNKQFKIINSRSIFILFLFLFIVVVSMTQSRFIPPGAKYMVRANTELFIHRPYIRSIVQCFALLFMLVPLYLTINLIKTKEIFYKAIYTWLIANAITCLYGIYGFIGSYLHFPFSGFAIISGYDTFKINRITSVGLEPLFFGASIMAVLPLGICIALIKRKKWLFWVIVFQLLAILLTFSRANWLAFIISLMIISFLFRKKILENIKNIVFILVGIFIALELLFKLLFNSSAFVYIINRFLYSFSGMADYSTLTRFDTWQSAWGMFKAYPILGVGIGNFWFHYYNYSPLLMGNWWIKGGGIPPTVNNLFLSFLAETGILGTSALLLFLFVLFDNIRKSITIAKDPEWRAILIGILACLVALLINYQFFSTFYFLYVWVLFGMSIAACEISIGRKFN